MPGDSTVEVSVNRSRTTEVVKKIKPTASDEKSFASVTVPRALGAFSLQRD